MGCVAVYCPFLVPLWVVWRCIVPHGPCSFASKSLPPGNPTESVGLDMFQALICAGIHVRRMHCDVVPCIGVETLWPPKYCPLR